MSRTKVSLVFLAGAISGIAAFIGTIVLWGLVSSWWPYMRPAAATVERIEQLASRQPELFTAKTVPRQGYRRWYVQGKENGREVIWGEWDKQGQPGVYLGHRRFPPDLQFALGGGCGWVHLRYDIRTTRLDTFMCNAPL